MENNSTLPSATVPLNNYYIDLVDNFSVEYKINTPENPLIDLVHFHECFEIVLYVQSDNMIFINDASYKLLTHDLIVIPPRTIHNVCYTNASTYCRYVMYFTAEYITYAVGEANINEAMETFRSTQHNKIPLTLAEFSRLNALFRNITHHQIYHSNTHSALIKSYATVILSELYFILKKQPTTLYSDGKAFIAENILRYINEHYKEHILLEDMEKNLFLNKYYLSRVFTATMNTSIMEYLQFKRIGEAQKLLDETTLPIIDICFECGFNNLQHFYRTFKKITSLTPKQFRDGNKLSFTQSIKNSSL
ncbi:MAG: AraC family transcriptional regulator [Ruthenibacterium sp.]